MQIVARKVLMLIFHRLDNGNGFPYMANREVPRVYMKENGILSIVD